MENNNAKINAEIKIESDKKLGIGAGIAENIKSNWVFVALFAGILLVAFVLSPLYMPGHHTTGFAMLGQGASSTQESGSGGSAGADGAGAAGSGSAGATGSGSAGADGGATARFSSLSETANADELADIVLCPCCGQPISANCCGMAKERKQFIEGLAASGIPTEDALAEIVKKYGMDSIMDEKVKEELVAVLAEKAPEERPVISISPGEYDFGSVSIAKGEVYTTMKITNTGKSPLVISKLESSCGCTTASVVYKGAEGPRFGMPGHGEMPTGWSVSIPAGESAELRVYYDPTVHLDLRGWVTRTVTVYSNDPVNVDAKVKITANQVD